MTHADLVTAAASWLRNTKHCGVVLTEVMSAGGEIPDAIGFQSCLSILVECKVSTSDLRRDQQKVCERAERRMGMFRYYLVPSQLVDQARAVAASKAWGVLSHNGRGIRTIVGAPQALLSERGADMEKLLLVSVLRRYQAQGIVYRKLPRTSREAHAQWLDREREVREARQLMGLEPLECAR